MDRRTFLARAGIVATWASIPITVSDCGKDNTMGPGSGGNGDAVGRVEIVQGHTHDGAVVTKVELQAGQAVVLHLTGSGHEHVVGLTAQEVMDIGAGTAVTQISEADATGHQHHVSFN
ncbi:MAG: hypothetical protein U0167_05900 [bacterium]